MKQVVATDKVLWVKFGWSDFYQGGPVDGNFPWLTDGKEGHEAFNFAPDEGRYCCYLPPQGQGNQPWSDDPRGWTVVCLAKNPEHTGIHIVGWYQNAKLEGKYLYRSRSPITGEKQAHRDGDWEYSVTSNEVFLVPPEQRTQPFTHVSVRQGKYSFLARPNVTATDNKAELLAIILQRLKKLFRTAIRNPGLEIRSGSVIDFVDPLRVSPRSYRVLAEISYHHADGGQT